MLLLPAFVDVCDQFVQRGKRLTTLGAFVGGPVVVAVAVVTAAAADVVAAVVAAAVVAVTVVGTNERMIFLSKVRLLVGYLSEDIRADIFSFLNLICIQK